MLRPQTLPTEVPTDQDLDVIDPELDSGELSTETAVSTRILRLILALMFGSLLVLLPLVIRSTDAAILGLLALVMLGLVALPVWSWKDYSLFEPMTFVILMVAFGCSFKLLYVIAFQNQRHYVDIDLLNGSQISVLIYGTTVVTVGIVFFLLGYWRRVHQVVVRISPIAQFDNWSEVRLAILSVAIILIAGYFFHLFARSIGVSLFSLESFSQKRFIGMDESNVGRDYREDMLQTSSYYYYRIAAFAKFAFLLNLVWMIHRRKPLLSWYGFIVGLSGIQTIAVFTFMNSRASVALVLLDAIVITYYLKDRIELWKVSAVVGVGMALLLLQLATRGQRERTVFELFERTVFGRDLMDVTKMAMIIDAIPERLEYCYGETLGGWLAAPIPKSVWPSKPLWSERGVFVNQAVYGVRSTKTGMTLGFPTELYWNFSWAGVCVGMFLIGVFLRYVYASFVYYRDNPTMVLLGAMVITRVTLFTLGTDLGTGVLKTALDLIPAILLIFAVGKTRSFEESLRLQAA